MTILERLKSETRELHEQLERRVDIPRRLQNRDAYRELLSAFYGFYAPLERELEKFDWAALGLDWRQRQKTGLLETDLHALGVKPATLPICNSLPLLHDPAEALGCLYVMEGATLGGQIIQKELATRLQIEAATGGAFFRSYGDRVGAMWAEFRQAVVRSAESTQTQDAVVAAAGDTFQKLDDWLAARVSI